jgi:hypothetical protein
LHLLPEEPDQVLRQARILEVAGETVATRYTLRELLDRLDRLTSQHQDRPGGKPG